MRYINDYSPQKKMIQLNILEEIRHGMCVSNLAHRVSKQLDLKEDYCYKMALAGMLHDIGKLRLNRYFRKEESTLIIEEMKYIRMHPKLGQEILEQYEYPKIVIDSILYHHENYDGTGYPDNLQDEEIPLGARILRVCDVFAALTSDRPYRKSFDKETALELMIEEVKNFDMKVFLALQRVAHEEDIECILDNERDITEMISV